MGIERRRVRGEKGEKNSRAALRCVRREDKRVYASVRACVCVRACVNERELYKKTSGFVARVWFLWTVD